MSFSVICQACGARLKLPPGSVKKKARCPKCNAKINLGAALDVSAYLPTMAKPAKPASATARVAAPPVSSPTVPFEREEDPLPYPAPKPIVAPTLAQTTHCEVLSLDDDSPPDAKNPLAGKPAPAVPPFRIPARVTADSAALFTGPCEAVVVPHGLFLESVPYRPFLYVPIGLPIETVGRRSLVMSLPDKRTVSVELLGANAGRLADDVAAFLVGERPMPEAREYRRNPKWLLWLALIFALGLAVGPVVMSQTTELGLETGLLIGAGFAGVGLLANAMVVLFTRMSVFGKVFTMTVIGGAMTGVFLFGATAYLAGKREAEQPKPDPPPPPPVTPMPPLPIVPPPKPPDPKTPNPDPPRRGLATAADAAYRDGFFRFDEGSEDVTAIAVSADCSVMVVGHKNGTTRVWRFDNATFDAFGTGPRADGPITRIQFDSTGSIVYLSCTGGMVAGAWSDPPEVPVKIPGDPVVIFPFPKEERFAALRGNAPVLRMVPTATIKKPVGPVGKGKGFLLTTAKDETIPIDAKGAFAASPAKPTFLAWHTTGKLIAGQPDGSIVSWGATGPAGVVVSREHRAPVRAWAASPATWEFATGDDKGIVGLWYQKAMIPKTFTATTAAVTHLSFSPTGAHLAVADAAGAVWIWDVATTKQVVKTTRPTPVKAMAFGPTDDLLLLSDGKAVELWSVSELGKRE